MKKYFFLKYALSFLLTSLAVCILLSAMLYSFTAHHLEKEQEELLTQSSLHIQIRLSQVFEDTDLSLSDLLKTNANLLWRPLLSEHQITGVEFLLADMQGNVILSTLEKGWSKTLSQQSIEIALSEKEDASYQKSDLDGLFPKNSMINSLVMETEGYQHRQEGILFIILPPDNSFSAFLLRTLIIAALLLILSLSVPFILMHFYVIRPMHQLNKAAISFAEGDFSQRIPENGSSELIPLTRAYNQMAERVEQNDRIHQTFISNISHDLRTPLTTIGGFAQNMIEGTIPPEKEKHYLKIILDESRRLARLVQTLLEMSRMSAGERKYTMAPMDLCELSRITLLSFEQRLENKQLDVEFDCDKDNIFVLADQDAIQQVIYNLLDNALKFTPEKGFLSLRIQLQGQKALFHVRNSGEGIPEEELPHLFDRFYKSDRSRGLDKKGTGLGLFIAKSILNAHQEEIWVESLYGSYTQFSFSLPVLSKPHKNK